MSTDGNTNAGTLRVIEVTSGWAMGEVNNCLAVVWADQPDGEMMRRRATALEDLCRRHPGSSALVEIVESTSKPPSDATRKIAMEVFRQLANDLSAIAFVVEGSEVRTAITRAVITGMLFFVRQMQPSRVFKRPADMMEWVGHRIRRTDTGFGPTVISSLEELRTLLHRERAKSHVSAHA